jgi:hypothetical protein
LRCFGTGIPTSQKKFPQQAQHTAVPEGGSFHTLPLHLRCLWLEATHHGTGSHSQSEQLGVGQLPLAATL